jgi:hypothetical protein
VESSAATKLQAMRRGQQDRRRVQYERDVEEDWARSPEKQPSESAFDWSGALRVAGDYESPARETDASWGAEAALEAATREAAARVAAEEAQARAAEMEERAAAAEAKVAKALRANGQLKEEVSRLQQRLAKAERMATRRAVEEDPPGAPTEGDDSSKPTSRRDKSRLAPVGGTNAFNAASNVPMRDATREVSKAVRAAVERANAAEDYARGLAEKLCASESSVKMLRAQLYRATTQAAPSHLQHPAARSLPTNGGLALPSSKSAHSLQPGRRYAPAKLPKLKCGGHADENELDDSNLPSKGRRSQAELLKSREEGFDTRCFSDSGAFGNYGKKSRSGLKAQPRVTVAPAERPAERLR